MIKIQMLYGATEDETTQINGGLSYLNKVWSSDALKQKVLTHTKMDSSPGFENTDDSCQQVWDAMQAADISLIDYVYDPTREDVKYGVVGYEDEDGSVHESREFLPEYDAADIADNLGHETMHKLGYSHDEDPTPIRPYSAPYGVGQMISDLVEAMLANKPSEETQTALAAEGASDDNSNS